jgi:hypothetical protein
MHLHVGRVAVDVWDVENVARGVWESHSPRDPMGVGGGPCGGGGGAFTAGGAFTGGAFTITSMTRQDKMGQSRQQWLEGSWSDLQLAAELVPKKIHIYNIYNHDPQLIDPRP